MVNIIKQEITPDKTLMKKINFICDFCNTKYEFISGYTRRIDKTNLTYVEPHRVIIKGITFLVFNFSIDIYIENLSRKIKISELEDYIKNIV